MLYKNIALPLGPIIRTVTNGIISAFLRHSIWHISGDIQAVIWDLDGTILDTVSIHIQAWQRIFEEYGVTIEGSFEAFYYENINGIPKDVIIDKFLTFLDQSGKDRAIRKKTAYYYDELERALTTDPNRLIFDSSLELLQSLKQKGIKQVVATSNIRGNIILERLNLAHFFEAIVLNSEIQKGKPAPDIFLEAARRLNVDTKHSIVLEDAHSGITGAKAGEFFAIEINRTDYTDFEEADITVRDLSEVEITSTPH